MVRRSKNNTRNSAWRTNWPRNGDLKTWFRVMIKKCDAIADDDAAATKAHLPIEHLAKMGCVSEALRHVDRYLGRLPRQHVLATVRMAELGAKICLDTGNTTQMEHYLAIAEATEHLNTRKCDKGFSLNSVREFRAYNGLLDPADAINDRQRVTARFHRAVRQFKQALATDECESARVAVAEMEKIASEVDEGWLRQSKYQRVINSYAELKDAQAVKRIMDGPDIGDGRQAIDPKTLVELGLVAEAIEQTRRNIARELEQLRQKNDPNIHFPMMSIAGSLEFLVAHGAKDDARRWLHRALEEMPSWPVIEYGFVTSSVYHSLAEAMAMIDGKVAAENLLKHAITHANSEVRSDFRKGAIDSTLELKANIGMLDEAIEDARKLRSPIQRRKQLGRLLAKAKRWSDLGQVLSQVKSPEEAADIAWWIKFELPGGEVR